MSFVRESVMVSGEPLTFETGRLAKQAHGSILITYGESVVLVTAVSADERPGLDFFPLTCEYVEKTFAAGKIPGGFFKREGRLRDDEILTCRIMDRPLRPLFPEASRRDTQIIATVLSADKSQPDRRARAHRRQRRAAHLRHPVGRPDRRRPRRPHRRRVRRLPDVRAAGEGRHRPRRRLLARTPS